MGKPESFSQSSANTEPPCGKRWGGPPITPKRACLPQSIYNLLKRCHRTNGAYVAMNTVAIGIITHGCRCTPLPNLDAPHQRGRPPCSLPQSSTHNVISGVLLELRTNSRGKLQQHNLMGATIFLASSHRQALKYGDERRRRQRSAQSTMQRAGMNGPGSGFGNCLHSSAKTSTQADRLKKRFFLYSPMLLWLFLMMKTSVLFPHTKRGSPRSQKKRLLCLLLACFVSLPLPCSTFSKTLIR